jgi:uroporphyrinogen decarboxylase
MKRRDALKAAGAAAATWMCGPPAPPDGQAREVSLASKSKRQRVLELLDEGTTPSYRPAAFFLHFGEELRRGPAAVEKHLEFFRHTGMDFVKIQYEAGFPGHPEIVEPGDWARLSPPGLDFYEDQLAVVEGLVKAKKDETLVVVTLYSPFMLAGTCVGKERLVRHIETDPQRTQAGLEIVTASLLGFVRECVRIGVDGFYHSTQGAEAGRFARPESFLECVKPFDLRVMQEVNQSCPFNILHVCDYHLPYDDLSPLLDYPGDVVSYPLHVGGERLPPKRAAELFGRPCMGGLDRKGTIATGSHEAIRAEVAALLSEAPDRFIVGADCTVPAETDWDNLRVAIETAHAYRA